MRVSVCMATYNGDPYLAEQLTSIRAQLGANDELIIADDASSDLSCALVRGLDDHRITLLAGRHRRGHVARFAEAMAAATNDIVVLADQDDIWLPGRLAHIKQALAKPGALVVAGNFCHIDSEGNPLPPPSRRLHAADSSHYWTNITGILLGRRPYYGCAMAYRRDLNPLILPIPSWVESHDLWLAFAANLAGGIRHLEAELLHKRLHNTNVSAANPRPWLVRLRSRWQMLRQLWLLKHRLRLPSCRSISQGSPD